MDERNNLDQALKYQTQTVTLIGAGALGDGIAKDGATQCGAASDEAITDACFADLVDKSFALTFTSKLNQSYTTKPIIVQDIANAVPATAAGAEAQTSMAVQSALHELPNYVVDSCDVTCTYEYAVGVDDVYPSVKCAVKFDGGSVAGPQYLLEVEADKCDSGCTPQLSNPVRLKSALRPSTEGNPTCPYPPYECGTAFWGKSGTYGIVGTAGIDDSATTLPVTDGADIGVDATGLDKYIMVGSEVMQLTAIAGTSLTVVRGHDGTTAAAHAGGDIVYMVGKMDGVHPDILSSVIEDEAADYNSFECGRRGKCDYSSGECECFEGYMGDRCQTQTALI